MSQKFLIRTTKSPSEPEQVKETNIEELAGGEIDSEAEEIVNEAENLEEILEESAKSTDDAALKSAFKAYSIYLRKYPRITPEREKELGRLIQKGSPEEAAAAFRELTEANLRLVVACAKRLHERVGNDSILDYLDMIQEGNLGLMTAVSKFDPEHGTRFSTYGVIWIRNAIERAMYKHKQAFSVPGYAGSSLYVLSPYIRLFLEGKINEIPKDKLRRVKELASIARLPVFIDQIEDPTTAGVVSPEHLHLAEAEDEDEGIINKMDQEKANELIHTAFLDTFTEEEYCVLCKRNGMGYYQSSRPSSIKALSSDFFQSVEYTRLQVKYLEEVLRQSKYIKEVYKAVIDSGCQI